MWRSGDLALGAVADGAAREPSRPPAPGHDRTGSRRGDRAARLPAHARHRALHRAVDALRRRHRRPHRHAPARPDRGLGRRRARVRARASRSSATPSPVRCSKRSTPNPHRWDLSALSAITSSGVTWSPETKRGLLAHLPGITLIDSLGASEGLMTPQRGPHRRRRAPRGLRGERPGRGRRRRRDPVRARRRPHRPARRRRCRSRSATTRIPRRRPRRSASVRWPALFDPRRLRAHRDRRHRHAARSRQRMHQHRRREGLPRRGRARAPRRTRRCSTASSSASPTSAGARWSSRSSSRPTDATTAVRRSRGPTHCREQHRRVQVPEALRRARLAPALARGQGRLRAPASAVAPPARSRRVDDRLPDRGGGDDHSRDRSRGRCRRRGPRARRRAAPCSLDVREPDEWQAGHAPGARFIPLGELDGADRRARAPTAASS